MRPWIIATAVPNEDLSLPVADQYHFPAAFSSGSFTRASRQWSIVEKQAFALVHTMSRFSYITQRPDDILLYTDHSNLSIIFNPASLKAHVQRASCCAGLPSLQNSTTR